tara:strand:+ start:68 stop:238 length:171 start_codon:yes stop_codon:yes gene_type:complete
MRPLVADDGGLLGAASELMLSLFELFTAIDRASVDMLGIPLIEEKSVKYYATAVKE